MDAPLAETVAVAGALSSMEEATQVTQMAFILQWAMRTQQLAQALPKAAPVPVRVGPKRR
jgi:hypothetical protein